MRIDRRHASMNALTLLRVSRRVSVHVSCRMARCTVLCALLVFAVAPRVVSAQLTGLLNKRNAAADSAQPALVVKADSPRASYENFLRLARDNRWDVAANYLALAPEDSARGPQLARRLKLVLDQRLSLDPAALSPLSTGDTADGDRTYDRLGVIPGPSGLPEPVRIVRFDDGRLARWVFARSTVGMVEFWYASLGAPWLRDRLPSSLMREGPLHVLLWQWIGIAIAIPVLWLLALALGWLLRGLLARLVARTETDLDDLLLERLRGPFRLWIGAVTASPVLGLLDLNARVSSVLDATARGLVLLSFFWALLRAIRLMQEHLANVAWTSGQTQARTLVPLLGNLLRAGVAFLALLLALQQFGYPVGSLLATLGIGGIAIALAAQKTVEHLFGSVSLAADKAFRVGDYVRVGDMEGTVERIGLRSTSFRTRARTVVRIPNGKLAEDRIETFGERDRMLLRADLGIRYDTSPETITTIRNEMEAVIRAEPTAWQDQVFVHIVGFGDSAVKLRVLAWLQTQEYGDFLNVQNRLLLDFMRIIERHASGFAYPTRTVHHVWDGGSPPPATGLAGDASAFADGNGTEHGVDHVAAHMTGVANEQVVRNVVDAG